MDYKKSFLILLLRLQEVIGVGSTMEECLAVAALFDNTCSDSTR